MLFELGSLILNAALTDTAKQNDLQREKELERIRNEHQAAENRAARKHETTMAVIGGVTALLLAAAAAGTNDNQGEE